MQSSVDEAQPRNDDQQLNGSQSAVQERTTSSDDEENDADHVPDDLHCPITLEVMDDPVLLVQSGNTYERNALLHALAVRSHRDPLTNKSFLGRAMIAPNNTVKRLIVQWREQRQQFQIPRSISPSSSTSCHPARSQELLPSLGATTTPPSRRQHTSTVENDEQRNTRRATTASEPVHNSYNSRQEHQPKDHDVLFGRGLRCARHPGNVRLRHLVCQLQDRYGAATTNRRKRMVIELVLDTLRLEGVRFLCATNGGNYYVDATSKQVHQKLSHMFRDRIILPTTPTTSNMSSSARS